MTPSKTGVLISILFTACACDGAQQQPPASPPQPHAEPLNSSFIGKAWIGTSSGRDRGSIMVFLPDRTLVRAGCPGPVKVSTWGVFGEHIRWVEDSIPIEAEVLLPSENELRLNIIGSDRPESYVLASPPYVCSGPAK